MMKTLQKLGKAMMLPVAALPICGILMGLGYLLCPSTMQGGTPEGVLQIIGFFLVKAGGALIDNMAILFAVGVGVGLAKDNDGTAGLAGIVSYLMITTLLAPGSVGVIAPDMVQDPVNAVAFAKVGGNAFFFADEAEQKMLRSHVGMSQLSCGRQCVVQGVLRFLCEFV